MSIKISRAMRLAVVAAAALGTAAAAGWAARPMSASSGPARGATDRIPLAAMSHAFADLAEQVKPSVVYITASRPGQPQAEMLPIPPEFRQFFDRGPAPEPRPSGRAPTVRGSGSGFIVSADGFILTNHHVVDGAQKVQVRLLDRRGFDAKVVGSDAATDVAVLKIDAKDLTPATLGASAGAQVGEWVMAVGNPFGDDLTFTVTSGIISAKGRALQLPGQSSHSIRDFIQTDAAINPGNSGGPLVDVDGTVIGINSAIASPTGAYAGYGFAVPIDLAKRVMEQLIESGRVERVALGILARDASEEDAQYANRPDVRGVVVQDFAADSPARKAGVQAGDLIVAVDGQPIEYVAQLQERVGFRKPGEVVAVEVARKGGKTETIRVRLQRVADVDAAESAAGGGPDPKTGPRPEAAVAALGVAVTPLTEALASELGLPPRTGGRARHRCRR